MRFDTLQPTVAMLSLVGEIDEFKGAWGSLSSISPDRLAQLRRIATIESIGSSTRIEGAVLTDVQVEQLLAGLETESFRSRDQEEVAGYAEVMDTVFQNWSRLPFTENHIKQLHGSLLRHTQKDERHRGNYKTVPNHVEAFDFYGKSQGILFRTCSPFDTPFRMTAAVEWATNELKNKTTHPLVVIAAFIVEFLAIHPFQDGNGRLSRILTTLLLLKAGYLYVPYSSLESVIEANKEKYYLALRQTQKSFESDAPDWNPWVTFFLQSMQKQKLHLQKKIERERIMHGALPPLAVTILQLLREHGTLQMESLQRLTSESRSTIRKRLIEMIELKLVQRSGKGPATWYTLLNASALSAVQRGYWDSEFDWR